MASPLPHPRLTPVSPLHRAIGRQTQRDVLDVLDELERTSSWNSRLWDPQWHVSRSSDDAPPVLPASEELVKDCVRLIGYTTK